MDVSLDGQVRQHIYMEGNLYTVLAETPKGPKKKALILRELLRGRKGLPEPPTGRDDVEEGLGLAIAASDLERQALPVEVRVGLPVDTPVPGHGHPPRSRALNRHRLDGPAAANVRDQHQLEVVSTVDGEPDPALLHTRNPAHVRRSSTYIRCGIG